MPISARVRDSAAGHPALWAGGLYLLVVIATRPASLRKALTTDAGQYLYVADVLLHGGTPYVDASNDKGPLTYLLFTGIRLVAGTSSVGVRLLVVVFAALASLALAAYVTHFAGRAAGFLAGLVFALFAATQALEGDDINTEQIGVAPMTGAWWLATRPAPWSAAGAGALVACCGLLNVALLVVIPFVVVELWRSSPDDRGRRLAAAAGGAILTTVPFAIWLGAAGALPDFWTQVFHHAGSSIEPGIGIARPPVNGATFLDVPASGLWIAGLVGCAVAMMDRRLRRVAIPAAAWIVVAFVRVRISSYEFPHHYYPALPGIAAGIAVGIAAVWPAHARMRIAVAALVLAFPVWTLAAQPQLDQLQLTPVQRWAGYPFPLAYPVAAFVRSRTCPGDTLLMADSAAYVNWLANRRAPDRFFDVYGDNGSTAYRRERQADLLRSPPTAIGRTAGPPLEPELQALIVRDGYRLAYNVNDAQVWLRPDAVVRRRC